ncbi:O-antigen ligase family protein [Chitinophagaceae bacterium 26-R-25]|nr:O-antigen ligase family protein [Chitinophagaceae bacterium 26-R-25]
MTLNSWRDKLFVNALCLIAFTIPFPYYLGAISVWVLVFAWLIQGDFVNKIRHLSKAGYLVWIAYFLLFAASYFYSDNKEASQVDLVAKLSFVIFPILIGTAEIDKKTLEKIFISFIAGISAIAIYAIVHAFYMFHKIGDPSQFFYHTLVITLDANAVYMSFYVIFSLYLFITYRFSSVFTRERKFFKWSVFGLLVVFFILLSCRLLIFLFFMYLGIIAIKFLFRNPKKYMLKISILAFVAITFCSIILFTKNPVKERYLLVARGNIDLAFQKDFSNKDFVLDNVNTRLLIWRVAMENIRERNLWWKGCGNGDINDIQNEKLLQLGVPGFKKEDGFLSPLHDIYIHNMYLQTLEMIGIPGLICLLLILILPFFSIKYVKNKGTFYIFQSTGILFMMQESVLQIQAGVIYFTFFSIVFWSFYYSQKKPKEVMLRATV